MKGGTVEFEFTGDTSHLNRSVDKIGGLVRKLTRSTSNSLLGLNKINPFKNLTTSIFNANTATLILHKTFGLLRNSMDEAISRVDTLNLFPNVMSNLGISTETSKKAIDRLSEKLIGLPTTLDAGASAVKRLTAGNKDVEKSVDIFLAFNNAVLAGGALPMNQAAALEQFSQAYAKGKPDMIEWRSMLQAMPAQMSQVADALNLSSTAELGESLRTGAVTMQQFTDKIVELNETGINGLPNFEEQARNATGGIKTALTNLHTSVVRGVGNVINTFNELKQSAGLESISSTFLNAIKNMNAAFDIFTKMMKGEKIDFSSITENLTTNLEETATKTLEFTTNIAKNLINGFSSAIPILTKVINTLIPIVINALNDMLPNILSMLINVGTSILDNLLQLGSSLSSELHSIINSIVQALLTSMSRLEVFLPLIKDVGTNLIDSLITSIEEALPIVVEIGGRLISSLINGLTEFIPQIAEVINSIIPSIVELLSGMLPDILNLILETGFSVINILETVIESISSELPSIINSLVTVLLDGLTGIVEMLPELVKIGIDIIKNLIKGLVQAIPKLKEQLPKIIDAVIESISGIVSALMDALPDLIDGLMELVTGVIDFLIGALPQLILGLLDAILTNIPTILDGLINGLIQLVISLIGAIPQIIQSLIDYLPQILDLIVTAFLTDGLTSLIEIGVQLIKALVVGLVEGIPQILEAIWDCLVKLVKSIKDFFPRLIESGKEILKSIVAGILHPNSEEANKTSAGKVISTFIQATLGLGWKIVKVGATLIAKLIAGLLSKITGTKVTGEQLLESIRGGIAKGFEKFKNLGKNLIEGLWKGIKDAKDWLISKIKKWTSDCMASIKKFFGVGSPSVKFAWIGKMNVLGLEKGMLQEKAKMQDIFKDIFDSDLFELSPNIYRNANSHFSPTINVNIKNDLQTDPLGQIVNDIKTYSGGAKNDYNYGMGVRL